MDAMDFIAIHPLQLPLKPPSSPSCCCDFQLLPAVATCNYLLGPQNLRPLCPQATGAQWFSACGSCKISTTPAVLQQLHQSQMTK